MRPVLLFALLASLALAAPTAGAQPASPSSPPAIEVVDFDEAAALAVATVNEYLDAQPQSLDKVVFCCFSTRDLEVYRKLLGD